MSVLKPYKRKPGAEDPAADFADQILALPHIEGVLLEGLQTDGTSNPLWFKHPLGRSFKGCVMAGQDDTGINLRTASPQATSAAGKDPATWFGVEASAGVVVTFNVLVF